MDKKLRFFKNVVANLILGTVVITVFVIAFFDNSIAVSLETPINKGKSNNSISLMINLYNSSDYIGEMAQILDNNGITATFFVSGMWASENGEALKKLYASGHEIGNHGFFHKDHKKISAERNREEIEVTHRLIKNILGFDMSLFSPPLGSFSQETLLGAKALGYQTIMYSIDTSEAKSSNQIFKLATTNLSGGEIILLYPNKDTVAVLDNIIKTISLYGFEIRSISTVIV